MINAIILAAGKSVRMGKPKMTLAWKNTTILGQVIETAQAAGITYITVVTGAARKDVENIASQYGVTSIFNGEFESGEMLSSIQCGLRRVEDLRKNVKGAVMLFLGDQPQIQEGSVRHIVQEYERTQNPLIVPSHQNRRGHPWLVGYELWGEILNLKAGQTMRDFLNAHKDDIHYVDMEGNDILQDIDTPDDYLKSHS